MILFLILVIGFWPLRLLRFYWGFAVLYSSWIILYLYSVLSTQLTRAAPAGARPSKLWLFATIPVAILAMDLAGQAVTRASGFRSFSIPTVSMEKTIQRGDRIVVDMYYYRSRRPARKDVVVFKTGDAFFIKRVVAIGGETISSDNGDIIINGHLVPEPYVIHEGPFRTHFNPLEEASMYTFGPVTVPGGKYFVMGDNRDESLDSRSEVVGLDDYSAIVGKALYVYGSGRQGEIIH